ncbi:MAG TPA: hypothetical protein VGI73_08440 [Solirubrobacterales bacterium]|jgi:hypothetical protein
MKAKARIVALLGFALLLAAPALAQASLPKTSTKSIVPGKSIGGLGLGGSQASMEKAWGSYPGGKCEQICSYFAPSGGSAGEVRLETKDFVHFKAFEVLIKTGVETVGTKDVANCETPLVKYETSKKIHLCSTRGALLKAYPNLTPEGSSAYLLRGPGKKATIFSLTEDNKVFLISIVSHPPEDD